MNVSVPVVRFEVFTALDV